MLRAFMLVAILASAFLMTACEGDDGGVVRIRERMFATQVMHIYANFGDYLGRDIQLEGLFLKQYWDELFYFVLRFMPDDCCGGAIGFEVKWPDGSTEEIPEDGAWVQATGRLQIDVGLNLYLELSSLNVLERRGAEIVTR